MATRPGEGAAPLAGVRRGVVPRDALVERFRGTDPASLVVVSAPAGYGKTTSVVLWEQVDVRPFARVALDHRDDDDVHLLQHVACAVDPIVELGPALRRLLVSPGRSVRDEMLPELVARLDDAPPFVLVFDDVQAVHSDAASLCVATLVDTVPSHVQPVLMGRSMPPVCLARRRLEGAVCEIGPTDLAFSVEEAQRALERQGLFLDLTATADLVERTEGWPAGLHLAALAVRGGRGVREVLSGRNRLVADYLVEEVLGGLEPEVTRFLEESAVIERMDGELLDELLERDDSISRLRSLEDSGNLLLVPLDDERRVYRYHHLFAEMLRDRLRARDPERARRLHRRAADIFESTGDLDTAITHAVAAGDEERAAALVMREAVPLVFGGRSGVLARRLSSLPEGADGRSVDAAVATAWYGIGVADPALILRALRQTAALDDGRVLGDGTPGAAIAKAMVLSILCIDGIPGIVRDTDVVVEGTDWTTNPWWGLAAIVRATALAGQGDLADARRLFTRALPMVHVLPGMEAGCHAWLALLALAEDDIESASRHADAARRIADERHLDGVVATMIIYGADALVSARSGDRDRAEASIAVADRLLDRLGETSPRTALLNRTLLARAYLALGVTSGARTHVRGARRAADREPAATWLIEQLHEVEAHLDAAASLTTLVTPLTQAELRVLPHLATHLSLQEIAAVIHVSRNTAKTHSVAIYRKLGVTSRSDAVARARQLGLLPD